MKTSRRYRLSAPDPVGVLFGLSAPQVVSLGVGTLGGVLAMWLHLGLAAIVIPPFVMVLVSFLRVADEPLVMRLPLYTRWITGRRARRWDAHVPFVADEPSLPPPLAGQVIIDVDPRDHSVSELHDRVAVVHDPATDHVAATVRVSGRQFALLEEGEQDRLLDLWGQALGGFSQNGSSIVAVRWMEWAAPGGMEDELDYVRNQVANNADELALGRYESLLSLAAPSATRHEVLVTLVCATRRVQSGDKRAKGINNGITALLRQLALFRSRLESADLHVSLPLTVPELNKVLRTRLDPSSIPTLNRRGRVIGERGGAVRTVNNGPLATHNQWDHWRVDGAYHRCFYVAEWPRLDLPASWMQELVRYGVTVRTIAMHYEPVPHRVSARAIRREASGLQVDSDERRRRGFHVGAEQRRAVAAVEAREEELMSGYVELTYAGVVHLTGTDLDDLRRACGDFTQIAASCGIELRALDGRHDVATAACLPLARGLAVKRPW